MSANTSVAAFNNVNNTNYHNSNFNVFHNVAGPVNVNQTSINGRSALQYLHDAVVKYAGQTTDRPDAATPCLPGTRKTARVQIDEWKCKQLAPKSDSEMAWLTGPAGSGKTSVAESTCEAFREEDLLVADCFFSQSIGRTRPQYLSLTIAYQLATSSPLLKPQIEEVVLADPSVVDASMSVQFKRLVLDPLEKASTALPTIFIIIDGLDECAIGNKQETTQREILHILQSTISDGTLPIRFLVASRPEVWITNTLISTSAPSILKISLDQNRESDADIRLFYITEFKRMHTDEELRYSLPPFPITWPSDSQINGLVENACGQFVYATTVTRILSDPGHAESPVKRLELILQPTHPHSSNPFKHLDALYNLILSSSTDPKMLEILVGASLITTYTTFFFALREILSILVVLWELESGTTYRVLRNSHSVLFIPHDLTAERETMSSSAYTLELGDKSQHPRFYHKSFRDFLHNPQRAGKFYINPMEIQRKLAMASLRVLRNVASIPGGRLHAVTWRYAHHRWDYHCIASGSEGNKALLEDLQYFSFVAYEFRYVEDYRNPDAPTRGKMLSLMDPKDRNSQEALKGIADTLSFLHLEGLGVCELEGLRSWVKSQRDIGSAAFWKLRLKLWYLKRNRTV